jgi:hypothetical protein
MKACQASMFCADEKYVMYGLGKEDYNIGGISRVHGTEGADVAAGCPSKKRFRVQTIRNVDETLLQLSELARV